jgi:hypothetical protein
VRGSDSYPQSDHMKSQLPKKLIEMTYADFGRLRFLDWFSKGKDYYLDSSKFAGFETVVGMTSEQGNVNSVVFCSKRGQLVLVDVDFTYTSDKALNEIHAFFDQFGIPLRKGLSRQAVTGRLGKSTRSVVCWPCGWTGWVVGRRALFCIVCGITGKNGLISVKIYRKDLADQQYRREYGG